MASGPGSRDAAAPVGSARDDILRALRAAGAPPVARPTLPAPGPGTAPEALARRFAEQLAGVGGRCLAVADASALEAELERLPACRGAARIASALPGMARRANVEIAGAEPSTLAGLDFALLPGHFAVAENGAVWVTEEPRFPRAAYFLAEHVALVVPAGEIVADLHAAYARLHFQEPGFGAFVSGPSKTADIEQALVIGAHGPRSLTVFLLGS